MEQFDQPHVRNEVTGLEIYDPEFPLREATPPKGYFIIKVSLYICDRCHHVLPEMTSYSHHDKWHEENDK